MALENKLGLESSSNFAREEELISKKKPLTFLTSTYFQHLNPENFLRLKRFTNISLMRFVTLPEKSAPSTFQKATSVLLL